MAHGIIYDVDAACGCLLGQSSKVFNNDVIVGINTSPVNAVGICRRSDFDLGAGGGDGHCFLIIKREVVDDSFAVCDRLIGVGWIIGFFCGAGFKGDRPGIDDELVPGDIQLVVVRIAGIESSLAVQFVGARIRSGIACHYGQIAADGQCITVGDDTADGLIFLVSHDLFPCAGAVFIFDCQVAAVHDAVISDLAAAQVN